MRDSLLCFSAIHAMVTDTKRSFISSAGSHYAERISCKITETLNFQSVVSAPLENVSAPGADPGGRLGRSASLKPTKATLFIIILYDLRNKIRNIRLFCRPLFWHSSAVRLTSFLLHSEAFMRLDFQILLKSPP